MLTVIYPVVKSSSAMFAQQQSTQSIFFKAVLNSYQLAVEVTSFTILEDAVK